MDQPLPESTPKPASPKPGGGGWSIGEVERDTGLGKDTLRVWERRYGFPTPHRDAFGERQYPTEQVLRLRLIKRLMDAGHRPGQVVAMPLDGLEALAAAAQTAQARERLGADAPASAGSVDLHSPWLEWVVQNRPDRVRQGLQQHILRHGLADTVEQVVAPLCVLVGEAWLRGTLSVYQEHLFTQVVQSVLREAIAAVDASANGTRRRPRVLLTTTPSEQHGLGLLMAECFMALESCERHNLGTATPIADIALAVEQLEVDVLALSFSAHASSRDLSEGLQQLVQRLPAHVEVWVGGAAVAQRRRGLPEVVTVARRASDVIVQVAAWRLRHGGVKSRLAP